MKEALLGILDFILYVLGRGYGVFCIFWYKLPVYVRYIIGGMILCILLHKFLFPEHGIEVLIPNILLTFIIASMFSMCRKEYYRAPASKLFTSRGFWIPIFCAVVGHIFYVQIVGFLS